MPDYQYAQPAPPPANKSSCSPPCLVTLGVLLVLAVIGIGGLVGLSFYFADDLKEFQKGFYRGFDDAFNDGKLKEISEKLNKTVTGVPDDGVLFVGTTTQPHPNRRIIYHFKVMNLSAADASPQFAQLVRDRLIKTSKGSDDMKNFADLKATVVFEYHDKDDVLIASIPISPDDLK